MRQASRSADEQGWDRLQDESVYAQCLPDNNPTKGPSVASSSPPSLMTFRPSEKNEADLPGHPGWNTPIVDFALAAIDGASWGKTM